MKSILTVSVMLIGTSAFSQEIPNVWKYRGMDTVTYFVPLMKNGQADILEKYRQDEPFVIIPRDPSNSMVFRMPVIVPPPVTVGLIPNPGLNMKISRSIMTK